MNNRLSFLTRSMLVICLTSAATSKQAAGQDGFRDKFREVLGFDAGKRRVQRESLVRGPDGAWQQETASGLTPHACQAEYVVAEDLFRREQYSSAATAFRRLGEKYKGSALEEDCLFLEAECYFKDGRLPTSVDAYHKLLKDFPTSRHMSVAVQRTYDVAGEWLEDSKLRSHGQPGKYQWWNRHVNFFDRRRPMLDSSGRAIEAIEHIQQFDPNGPLTPTATMMAGAEKFTTGDYIRAAGYYEQIVVSAPKSEHASKAAVLAAQSYMRSYQGAAYDAEDLLKAQQMTEAALRRAAELPPEQKQKLEADLKNIFDMQAERQFHDGQTYAQLRKYRGAQYCYARTIKRFPDTQWAQKAQAELNRLEPMLASTTEPTGLRYEEESSLALPKVSWPQWKAPSLFPKQAGGDADIENPIRLPVPGADQPKPARLAERTTEEAVQLPPAIK